MGLKLFPAGQISVLIGHFRDENGVIFKLFDIVRTLEDTGFAGGNRLADAEAREETFAFLLEG